MGEWFSDANSSLNRHEPFPPPYCGPRMKGGGGVYNDVDEGNHLLIFRGSFRSSDTGKYMYI